MVSPLSILGLGLGLGGLGSLFGGSDKLRQLPTMAPYQQRAFQGAVQNPINASPLYGSGSNYLQGLLSNNPESFRAFEAPYLQNFQQNIAPGIAERFAGAGTGGGAMSSSGLNQSLAQAGRNLQTDLAGLRSGLQMQALPQALSYAQQPYSNVFAQSQISPFAYQYQRRQPSFLETAGQGILGGIGQGAGLASGGPLGDYFKQVFGHGTADSFNFGRPAFNIGAGATNSTINNLGY